MSLCDMGFSFSTYRGGRNFIAGVLSSRKGSYRSGNKNRILGSFNRLTVVSSAGQQSKDLLESPCVRLCFGW